MKTKFFFTLFFLSIIYCSNAQEHCTGNFEAYSRKIVAYCKYCNESKTFIIPSKIKFNKTLVCESLQNIDNASSEGKCKAVAIVNYLTFLYYTLFYKGNAFYSEKCYNSNNPKETHAAYLGEAEDVGLKQYSFDDLEAQAGMDSIEETRSYIDYGSFQEGRSESAKYAIGVLKNSCN
jgi:hypothetical protein